MVSVTAMFTTVGSTCLTSGAKLSGPTRADAVPHPIRRSARKAGPKLRRASVGSMIAVPFNGFLADQSGDFDRAQQDCGADGWSVLRGVKYRDPAVSFIWTAYENAAASRARTFEHPHEPR